MSGNFFGGQFFGGGFFGALAKTAPDTHDDPHPLFEDDISDLEKRLQEERASTKSNRDRIRQAIEYAIDGPPEVAPQLVEQIKDVTTKLESGALRIDYEAIGRKLEARLLQIEREQYQRMLDEDDEDVFLLL